jgi:hypothetical protein
MKALQKADAPKAASPLFADHRGHRSVRLRAQIGALSQVHPKATVNARAMCVAV